MHDGVHHVCGRLTQPYGAVAQARHIAQPQALGAKAARYKGLGRHGHLRTGNTGFTYDAGEGDKRQDGTEDEQESNGHVEAGRAQPADHK